MQRDLAALCDIYNYACEAVGFIKDMEREAFFADRKTQLAVLHLIALIGEAARRTAADFRIQHAALPWPQMIGLRNVLVHEYDDVDIDRIWDVLIVDLPNLIQEIEPIMPKPEDPA